MVIFGLDGSFPRELLKVERSTVPTLPHNAPKLRVIQHHHIAEALASFAVHIYPWYPILPVGFTEWYHSTLSGALPPGPQSSLALVVVALGLWAQQEQQHGACGADRSLCEQYLVEALSSLPIVTADSSLESVQFLLYLAVYYCCCSKPCQAYEYAAMASIKVQNLVRSRGQDTEERQEQTRKAYWAILLLESEIQIQFDLVETGIWHHEEKVPLPNGRLAWSYDFSNDASPASIADSVRSAIAQQTEDKTQSYFLAEIAMRRMLHRCNSATRRNAQGDIVYASGIALELESQLEEWYNCLPQALKFHREQPPSPDFFTTQVSDPTTTFLRVQYYCCKISIYWPAIYTCMQDSAQAAVLLDDCRKFFNSYLHLAPSILSSVQECFVNRWTLFGSIFMTTMAAVQATSAADPQCCTPLEWSRLLEALESMRTVQGNVINASPSLLLLAETLSSYLDTCRGEWDLRPSV